MAADEHTDAGQLPPPGLFRTTHWGLVLGAQENSETALDALFQFYHRPLLIWLQKRANDYAPLEPEDLLQGFCEHLLGREFLSNVRPENGKFRTFLLTSLKNYVRDRRDKDNTLKRGGGQSLNSLQETDDQGQPLHDPAASSATPDVEFDRAWV